MERNGIGRRSNADFARLFRDQQRRDEDDNGEKKEEHVEESDRSGLGSFSRQGIGAGLGSSSSGMNNRGFAQLFQKASTESEVVDDDQTKPTEDSNPMRRGLGTWGRGGLGMSAERGGDDEHTVLPEVAIRAGLGAFQRATRPDDEEKEATGGATEAGQTQAPAKPAKPVQGFGWQKHTKGFGLKMMAKLGFSGRLGKNEQGVSGTIHVKQRPNQMGLGFGDFVEASSLKANQKLQKELRGETVDDEEDNKKRKREMEAEQEDESLWRKRKAVPSGTKKYKKAADITEQALQQKRRKELIVDMRGPDVRVLADVTDAYGNERNKLTEAQLEEQKPKLGDEVIYNVRMVVNLSQGKICDLTQKIAMNKELVVNMRKEAKIIQGQVEMERARLQHIAEIVKRTKQLETVAAEAMSTYSTVRVLEVLQELRTNFGREFDGFKLSQLVPSLCIPILQALVSISDLAIQADQERLIGQYRLVQLFLVTSDSQYDQDMDGPDGTVSGVFRQHRIRERSSESGEITYNFILEETLWPTVVHFINVQWDPTDAGVGLDLFARFQPQLSPGFASAFLHDLVLPRLKKECQRWRPGDNNSVPMHLWVLPWRPLLESEVFATLSDDVQLALGAALGHWHPSNASVVAWVIPWRDVWSEQDYAKFSNKHIVRKLIRVLHREFEVNPQQQSLDALKWILVWRDHLPLRQVVALFEGEFFPQWLRVLRRWVEGPADLRELEIWYLGWKKFFSKAKLAREPRLILHFHQALVLLNAACEGSGSADGERRAIPELCVHSPKSYQEALVRATTEPDADNQGARRAEAEKDARQTSSKQSKTSHVSLKDVVEHLAISSNLMFMPKGLHDGQRVYVFGNHHILIEQGVVFVEKQKGNFVPIDIGELV
ncbi:TPA: hypothetical protein N0F65_006802 [Lagenidium giganteum]|uniref:G-patch domain-containing protein n=1 Tax=Lagenidium giganteum TaxID=4803 RepID=A0AAV2Z9L2_9STRA|nr:TPA: hypothetical protein N0F65_006802 [Lagenidium giganteum]